MLNESTLVTEALHATRPLLETVNRGHAYPSLLGARQFWSMMPYRRRPAVMDHQGSDEETRLFSTPARSCAATASRARRSRRSKTARSFTTSSPPNERRWFEAYAIQRTATRPHTHSDALTTQLAQLQALTTRRNDLEYHGKCKKRARQRSSHDPFLSSSVTIIFSVLLSVAKLQKPCSYLLTSRADPFYAARQ